MDSVKVLNISSDFHFENENYYTLKIEVQIEKNPIVAFDPQKDEMLTDFFQNYSAYKKIYETRDFEAIQNKIISTIREFEDKYFEQHTYCRDRNFKLDSERFLELESEARKIRRSVESLF